MVRSSWEAIAHGDLDVLAEVLAPDARWRAVEDGPWNCSGRAQVLEVMAQRRARGALAGAVEEVLEVGARTIVAFRPQGPQQAGGWPLDEGLRYVVLSFRGDLVCELKGCADRAGALAYAAA